MACGSQSRGLNSVRCFPEPVLLPARRSPPRGRRPEDPDSSRLPGKQRLPRGCVRHFQVLCSSETTHHPPPPQPPRLPEVEAGGCHSHSTSVVLLVTGFSSSVTRASRKIPDAAS